MGRITFYFVYTVQMFMYGFLSGYATLFVHEGTPGCVCVYITTFVYAFILTFKYILRVET